MERVHTRVCGTCREKLERLYYLRDEPGSGAAAHCALCSFTGFIDAVSYAPRKDSKKGGCRTYDEQDNATGPEDRY